MIMGCCGCDCITSRELLGLIVVGGIIECCDVDVSGCCCCVRGLVL